MFERIAAAAADPSTQTHLLIYVLNVFDLSCHLVVAVF